MHSRSADPAPDPVFFLNGGPGGAIVAALPNMLSAFDPILAVRDVVFFDQRGAGWSQPALVCPETAGAVIAGLQGRKFTQAESLAPYLACRDRLQREGVYLEAYNTAENAADVEDLRHVLGYAQINLFGVSYGTMLAQVMMRDYADHIRSAVLDSAYPIWEYVMADAPASLAHYLETIWANCENDLVCRTAYPEARAVFAQLVDRLRQQPVTLTQRDPTTNEPITITIDPVDLIGWLVYTDPHQVPALLYDLRDGDYGPVLRAQTAMLKEERRPQWPLSEGMKISVMCNMRLFQVTPQQVAETNARFVTGLWANRSAEVNMALCANWPARPIDPREATPVHTTVPLLVIGGEYDPGSPPRYADTIAAASQHGYAFIVPEAGHAALISADPCATGIVYSFLNDPLRKPEGDCLSDTRGPGFMLRAAIARWPIAGLSLALLGVAAWSAWSGAQRVRRSPRQFSWRINLRLLGAWPVGISAAGVVLCLWLQPSGVEALESARVVETIVPLLAGVQAALLFSPEDEPGLEVTLACPRPLAWTILERVAWLVALQGSVALISTAVVGHLTGESVIVGVSRWLGPLLVLTGLGLCLTLMTRQAVPGVGLVMILWSGLMLASDQITKRWPFLWPMSLYLQPDQPDYWLSRVFFALLGLMLIRLAVTHFIRAEERLLLGRGLRQAAGASEE